MIADYKFYVSDDLNNWGAPVAEGTFNDDQNEKNVLFSGKKGRYIQLVADSEARGEDFFITTMAELNVLGHDIGSSSGPDPDPGPDPGPGPDPSLPTCAAPDICCPAGQLCSGGEGKNLAGCDNTCCTGGGICDDPPASSVCQNKGYKCCSSCKLDHQPEYDSSCATGICCAVCTYAPPPPLGEVGPKNPLKTSDFAKIVENVLTWSLSIVGSLVLLVLIFGGVMYISSAGDEQKVLNAKKIVTFAIMGLMIILGAYAIVKALSEVAA